MKFSRELIIRQIIILFFVFCTLVQLSVFVSMHVYNNCNMFQRVNKIIIVSQEEWKCCSGGYRHI